MYKIAINYNPAVIECTRWALPFFFSCTISFAANYTNDYEIII